MAVKIDIKHNNVAGVVPTTSSLNLGEIAINTYDGKAYLKRNNGVESIIEIGTGISGGTTNYIPLWSGAASLTSSAIYQSGSNSIIINSTANTTANPEALYVQQTHPTSFNVISGKGNLNNYLQLNIHNTNAGTSVSSDIVATANNGDENSYYIDMGINGSNFSGDVGGPNDAYLYATGSHLHIGNATPNMPLQFFVGGINTDTNRKFELNANNQHGMTGSLSISGGLAIRNLTTTAQSFVLTYNNSTGQVYYTASSTFGGGGGGGIPGGSTGQIQYNNAGAFGGVDKLTFDGTTLKATGSFTGSFTGSLQGTASYALTASYAMNGGGGATFPYVGNAVISGSLVVTGSTTIIGATNFSNSTTTVTGSFLVTGSTTQTGNNTLIGNTTLSGSIIISGSSGPGASTASVQIYGDIRQTGYHRFDPVSTNIDNSISASYIYVSGSTNDLYFTQNGQGYGNTTRLRWLEGGSLYTGILRGGVLSSTPGTTTFKITSGSGLIVTMNASTGSEPYPISQYISWPDYNAQPITYSGSAKITYVGIDSNGQIIQQTVPWGTNDINQWDNSINLGVVLHLSGSVSTGVFNAPQISYGGQQKNDDFFRAFGPLKISGHTLRASGSSPTLSIIKDAGISYREGANYVNNANHPSTVVENSINTSKIYRYYISGSTPVIDTGVGNAGYTAIDSKYYVDTTTGTLALVGGAYWSIQRVFWVPNSPTNAFIVYYGNDRYRSLVDATNARDSEPFIEAPNTAQNAIFVGYIIIQGGGSGTPARDLLNASEATIIPAGLFRNVGGIGSSGTNYVSTTLAGLADVALSGNTPGDLLVYGTGATWNNKKQLTGSYGLTGSLTVTQNISASSFTGSLFGTATTASYVNGNIFTNANSATSASYAVTASYILNAISSSFASTASYVNPLRQNVIITGSLNASGSSHTIIGSSTLTGNVNIGNSIITDPVLTIAGDSTLSYYPQIQFSGIGGSIGKFMAYAGQGMIYDFNLHRFRSAAGVELAKLTSTGLGVGIDTNNPSYKLEVSGTVAFTSLTTSSQASVMTINSSTGQLYYTGSSALSVGTAQTASYAQTLTIQSTLTDFYSVSPSTNAGVNNIFTKNTGSFTSAFGKYTIYSGSNSRAGEFVTSWNGTTTTYYDNATTDIGSTSGVVFSSAIVTGQIQISTGVSTPSGWQVKMLATFM